MRNRGLIWKPLPGTIPTLIYDAYGESILIWTLPGDTETPRNFEIAIRAAQTGLTVDQVRKLVKGNKISDKTL